MGQARLSLIAAVSDTGGIGHKGKLPWTLKTDLQRFSRLTTGKPVIMGRLTWESIYHLRGGPLPHRRNIVVSTGLMLGLPAEVVCVRSIHEAVGATHGENSFVIGGSGVFGALMSLATDMHITWVHAQVMADRFFPAFNPDLWQIGYRENVAAGENDQYATTYIYYERRRTLDVV